MKKERKISYEKMTSEFTFSSQYIDSEGNIKETRVYLLIKWAYGEYSIRPLIPDSPDIGFSFCDITNPNWRKYKSLLKCINKVMNFANRKLKFNNKSQ